MSFLSTLVSWGTDLVTFLEGLAESEAPVAKAVVAQVIAEAPQILTASKPLVAAGQVAAAAGEKALANNIQVSNGSLAVAAVNAVNAAAAAELAKVDPAAAS